MDSIINANIPAFSLMAFHEGEVKTITEKDIAGKWSVFFFYSADFSDVCAAELAGLADKQDEFHQMNVEIYSISTDSHFVHKAWYDRSEDIRKVTFPMLADRSGDFCRALGVLNEENGTIYPAVFVANPEGLIKIAAMQGSHVKRNAEELMRKVQAAIFIAEHPGEACPARWHEGDPTIRPSLDLVGKI